MTGTGLRLARGALLVGALCASALAPAAALQVGQVEAGALLGIGGELGSRHLPEYLLLRTLGFVVTDQLGLGVQLGLTGDFEAAPSSTLLAALEYHLPQAGPLTPYIGAYAGLNADLLTAHPQVEEALSPGAGAKWVINPRLLLVAQLRYVLQVGRPADGVLLLCLGFSLLDEPPEG